MWTSGRFPKRPRSLVSRGRRSTKPNSVSNKVACLDCFLGSAVTKRSQAYTGSDAVRSRAAQRRAIAEFRATGGSGEAEVQLAGSSPQHRTPASAGKKTPISGPFSPTPEPPDQDGLLATYEELRCQFLHGQRGPGLMLFLRGGMGELMNIFSLSGSAPSTNQRSTTSKQPAVASDHTVLPQGMRAEVVLILAGILLHSCQESRS